jgi:type I restriction enzyme, S subunit
MTSSVRLGGVVCLARDETPVSPDGDYRTAGILNRGRGLFERPPITGVETKYTKLFRLHEGQLVYSKLFGWEGSVAVVSQAFDGCFVSPEFPTFDADDSQIDRSYLRHVIRWDGFVEQLAGATTGMGQRRQRVNIEQFENSVIPLPDLDEQRRIANHLESLDGLAQMFAQRQKIALALLVSARNEMFIAHVRHSPRVVLRGILALERRAVVVEPGKSYRQIGIYSWGKGIIRREPVTGSELSKLRYFSFPPCALLLSNIQAWEGAVAVTGSDESGYVASNRFLPYLPFDENAVHVEYLRHYFLSEPGLTQIRQASPGTQVRNRTLGIKLFEDLLVPLPDIDEQRRIATHLDALDGLADLMARRAKVAQALPVSARNEIFSAMV